MKAFRALLLSIALVAALAGCPSGNQSHKPDLAACRAAMKRQLAQSLATGATGSRPPECHDVSDEDLQRIAVEILEGGQ